MNGLGELQPDGAEQGERHVAVNDLVATVIPGEMRPVVSWEMIALVHQFKYKFNGRLDEVPRLDGSPHVAEKVVALQVVLPGLIIHSGWPRAEYADDVRRVNVIDAPPLPLDHLSKAVQIVRLDQIPEAHRLPQPDHGPLPLSERFREHLHSSPKAHYWPNRDGVKFRHEPQTTVAVGERKNSLFG